jgi:methionyl-tRNA formyltransferase
LDYLKSQNIFPSTIITQPARPVGRKKILTETIVNNWGVENSISILKPEKLGQDILDLIRQEKFDLCLVASYGKILKLEFLDIFPEGVWNVHPSALPLYRGATPLQSQIIDGLKEIEVTVIKMDAGMDSGDILAQQKLNFNWERKNISELEYEAGFLGGEIFYKNFKDPKNMSLHKQDHTKATFTKILKKEDGDVTKEVQDRNLEMIWRKHNAYKNWPGVFFIRDNTRIKITEMQKDLATGEIEILKLLPESKKEISFADFENSYGKLLQ